MEKCVSEEDAQNERGTSYLMQGTLSLYQKNPFQIEPRYR